MTSAQSPSKETLAIAAEWLVRRRSGDEFDTNAFEAWLDADPQNLEAWARVKSVWESFDEYPTAPQLLELRTNVLRRAYLKERRWRPNMKRRALIMGGGAAVAAATVAGVVMLRPQTQSFSTGMGELRTIALPDTSLVTLDANSHLEIRFDRGLRRLELTRGRAHFDVAHDASRPFQVLAFERYVTALGTDFTVEVRQDRLTVALFTGSVTVGDDVSAKAGGTRLLAPLQALVIEGHGSGGRLSTLDAQRDLAWRDGRLIFNDEPLAAAAARMNDYSAKKIAVDPAVAGLRVTAMFMAGQTDAFVNAIEAYYPVRAETSGNGITLKARS